jgi:quercetin dioxygenase-like cupin family protein
VIPAGEPMLVHLHVRPGCAVSGEHLHPAMQEGFRVLRGALAARTAGVERTWHEGEAVTVAPGVWHGEPVSRSAGARGRSCPRPVGCRR